MAIEKKALEAGAGFLKARMVVGAVEAIGDEIEGVGYLFSLLSLAGNGVTKIEFGTVAGVYYDDWQPRKLRPARRIEFTYEGREGTEHLVIENDEEEEVDYFVYTQFGERDPYKEGVVAAVLKEYSDYREANR